MRTNIMIVTVSSVAVLLFAAVSAQQGQPVPGPGSGIMTVVGTVDVASPVRATQQGPWSVSLTNPADVRVANSPAVTIAPAEFLKKGGRYAITWSGGETESVVITQAIAGEWVRVETSGRAQRWVNLATARALEEVR